MSGIYVHFPFCKSKCIYCNFYSVATLQQKPAYLAALAREIEARADFFGTAEIDTLYFGGGTPTLLTISELEDVINKIRRHFSLSSNLEFTIEANPEQLSASYTKELKMLGINRLSIGVQSFNDEILQLLRRQHSAEEAKRAIENARAAGFNNLSIDLIYGIYKRDNSLWQSELATAFALPIEHLSAYSLTVEENTLLAKKIHKAQLPPISDEQAVGEFEILLEIASVAGFEQYEMSNFAKNGCYSRHNFSYWQGTPYLGLGAAAHSYNGSNERRWNAANLAQYIENQHFESEILSEDDQFNEYILLRLRTKLGVNLAEIEAKFGAEKRQIVADYFQKLDKKYFEEKSNYLILSNLGKLFADKIAMDIFV